MLADFIIEFTILKEGGAKDGQKGKISKRGWVLYVDGSSNSVECRAGLVLIHLEEMIMEYALRFKF